MIPIAELELARTVPQETERLRLRFREERTFGGLRLRLIFQTCSWYEMVCGVCRRYNITISLQMWDKLTRRLDLIKYL